MIGCILLLVDLLGPRNAQVGLGAGWKQTHYGLSIVDCRLCIVDCALAIVDRRLTFALCGLCIVDCASSIVHCRLRFVDCALSIADTQQMTFVLCTLDLRGRRIPITPLQRTPSFANHYLNICSPWLPHRCLESNHTDHGYIYSLCRDLRASL